MRRILCALLPLLFAPAIATAAPTIAIISPADGAVTNSTTVSGTFTADLSDPNNPIPTVDVNGTAATVNTTAQTFTASNVAFGQGPNTVTATINAPDGSALASRHITFDSVAPTVTITSTAPVDADDPNSTHFASVTVQWTVDDPSATVALFANGFPVTLTDPNVPSQRVQVFPGQNTISVHATDAAGNFGFKTIQITRLTVCDDPNFPASNAGDPNAPQTYTVDRTDDLADPNPDDDVCDVRPDLRDPNDPNAPFVPPLRRCTLRAAIQTANHHPGPDRIVLGSRVITLTRLGADEDAAATGDLDVTEDLRITGGSRDGAIIDGHKLGDRVFDVADGVKLQLVSLTVKAGRTPKSADPNDPERGGCVRSRGSLRANNAAFLNCKADGPGGAISLEPSLLDPEASATLTCTIVARSQSKQDGGGIASDGVPLTLRNSTVSLNSAGGRGGALSAVGNGDPNNPTLTNVTVSHNQARLAGGALDLGQDADARINSCTFTSNAAKLGATLSTSGTGAAAVSNSIFGDTSKFACDVSSPTALVSMGGNVERGSSCDLTHPSDLENVDPKLGKLATNGGPPTHALLIGSPAIDHGGTETACEPLDARDVERGDWPPFDDPNSPTATASPPFCDSGAFELRTPKP